MFFHFKKYFNLIQLPVEIIRILNEMRPIYSMKRKLMKTKWHLNLKDPVTKEDG